MTEILVGPPYGPTTVITSFAYDSVSGSLTAYTATGATIPIFGQIKGGPSGPPPTAGQIVAAIAGGDLSAATASPDGGATHPSLGTIAQTAASAVPASQLARFLATTTIPYPTPGFVGQDPNQGGGADTVLLTPAQTRGRSRLPAALWENNAAAGTLNRFLTQAGVDAALAAGNASAVLDDGLIINAAIVASRSYPHWLPAGAYTHNRKYLFTGSEDFEFEPGAKLVSTYNTSGGTNQFDCDITVAPTGRVSNVTLRNFYLAKKHTNYVDWFTNLFTNDTANWRTVAAGDWTGITNYTPNGWQTSAAQPFVGASNVRYYDALYPGITLAQLNASAPPWVRKTVYPAGATVTKGGNLYITSAGGTAGTSGPNGTGGSITDGTVTWSYVGAGSPVFLANNQYANPGSVVVGAVLTTINTWTGYAVTYAPAAGTGSVNTKKSPGAVPAILDGTYTTMAPLTIARPAIPPTSDYLLSAPPVFYGGGLMTMHCDNLYLPGLRLEGASNGRALTLDSDGFLITDGRISLPDGNSGSAGIRAVGGYGVVSNTIMRSGDDTHQIVPFYGYSALGGFTSASNRPVNIVYTGGEATSYSGRGAIMSLANNAVFNQTPAALGNVAVIPTTQTAFTFPPGVIQGSGITVQQLLTSQPEWQPGVAYVAGNIRSNGSNIYTAATSGTSDPNGNGPSGTGAGIVDGSTGLTWNYVSAGQPVYLGAAAQAFWGGSYVLAAVLNGDASVTITASPPPGRSTPLRRALPIGATINFSIGNPIGTGTNTCIGRWNNLLIRSTQISAVDVDNQTSSGLAQAFFDNCTVDTSYCFGAGGSTHMQIELNGGPINTSGGLWASLSNMRTIAPFNGSLRATGVIAKLQILGGYYDQGTNPVYAGPNVLIAGTMESEVIGAQIWASPAGDALKIGATNTIGTDGQTTMNTASNAVVRDNSLLGINDGQSGITWSVVDVWEATGNRFFPHSAPGTGSARGHSISTNATRGFVARNKYFVDGNPYALASGAVLPQIGLDGEVYNPAPAQTFAVPAPIVSAQVLAAVQAALQPAFQTFPSPQSNAAVVAAFTQPEAFVVFAQSGTIGSASVGLPAGASNGQRICFSSTGAITALTFTAAATNFAGGLAANSGLILEWAANTSTWRVV